MTRTHKTLLVIFALLFSTLACRAATNLILPDTPTPAPSSTPTQAPSIPTFTLPPPTETVVFEAACPLVLDDIVDAAINYYPEFMEEGELELYLVTYTIKDDRLDKRENMIGSSQVNEEQDARATHEFIWDYIAAIIPREEREFVNEFSVSTDGPSEVLAAVGYSSGPQYWGLEVDIIDSGDPYSLTFTLLHEFGHLLTLNSDQVPPNRRVYYDPDNESVYNDAVESCPQYFPGEGCSNPDSYINEFFHRFWLDFYDEWLEIDFIEDEDEYYDGLDDFYFTYQDQFLTDYAATSPEEDIAETWSFFILSPKPEMDSIANEKILFFYEYPELVTLRVEILNRICEAFPQ
ncbi:MAG: hypothetical protein R3307_08225 [Anaerolineales bacterium]|nr:hypothetical protein [Anaerolineales bacterium]